MLRHGVFFQTTRRSGWVQRGVDGPESVADHMYRMSIMAFLAGPATNLNRERYQPLFYAPKL